MNTAEPRSKQKTMGDEARGENNYRKSAYKKTLKDHKQKTFGATFCRLHDVRPQNMSHHPFIKTGRGVLKIARGLVQEVFLTYFSPRPLPYHFFFVLGSAFVRLNLSLYQTTEKKKEANKKTASYALVELYKPFNSLSFSVARDENSDRQQQNSGRDTK